ncbi:MAG: hypothetical protein H7A35_16010 [Planctomycetales bacterium]|nr:hypothetical protein [bacterium]UNM08333.1 MAG: hypothetical protein H7A35_16010 [Planctomycetales bacterium]
MPTRIRRYEEKLENLDSLLSRIEREMGPEAQLEAREFRRNGILGIGGQKMVEIIATLSLEEQRGDVLSQAAARQPVVPQQESSQVSDEEIRRELLAGYGASGSDAILRHTPVDEATYTVPTAGRTTNGDAISRLRDAFHRQEIAEMPARPQQDRYATPHRDPVAQPVISQAAGEPGHGLGELHSAMDEIRGMITELAGRQQEQDRLLREQAVASRGIPQQFRSELERLERTFSVQREELEQRRLEQERQAAVLAPPQGPHAGMGLDASQADVFDTLIEWNIPLADALELLQAATGQVDNAADPQQLLQAVRREICRGVLLSGGLRLNSGQRRVVALVGPTGVGKTTTIAKIAAQAVFEQGLKVAVVSLDTYRIAAAEQLRSYAEIMGLRFEVVFSPQEFAEVIDRLVDFDLVLVDTAGRSPGCSEHIEETASLLQASQPDEVHLVLAAGTQAADARRAIAGFARLGCSRLVLSKLDECVGLGGLHNIGRICDLPLSYFTTGQSVPEDIRSADMQCINEMMDRGIVVND